MKIYQIINQADERVADVFSRILQRSCDKEKTDKVVELVTTLVSQGKKLERAMADALETYKIDGAVNQ